MPDTPDGRFDLITLHMFLLLRRLKDPAAPKGLSQEVFDIMFQNMDDSLREMGVGDLKVGNKVRELAEQFFGRSAAYEAALGADDDAGLATAIGRNIYGDPTAAEAAPMAQYMREADGALADHTTDQIFESGIPFPPPPEPR